ncbi:MAG: T9SS type A sorting domain-containing protein [Prolixibacteraceae bacterium]|nr:T9SS type A sorting domain-containing protein [Prolixibacteraceae bacterium]
MKTQHIFILLFTISALQIQAHDYQTVYTKQTALFKNSVTQRIKALRIDSVKVAVDTILYSFATIQEVSAGCHSPYKASWIGEKVTIKPDGTNLFFNREGSVITLKTQALLNESWIAFQRSQSFRVEANVVAVELENMLGLSDLVKTIAFRVVDQQGNTVDHALNKLKVKISKRYGFVETLNFYLFPDISAKSPNDMLMNYSLVGLTNPKVGLQNLRWFEVNGFNPGDELHVQEHNLGDPNFYLPIREYDNRCIYKYLGRTNYVDSIVYRYARKQSIKTVYTDRTTLETHHDTLKSVILANPGFDKLPGEPIFNAGSAQQMFMRNDEFRMKIRPSAMNELYVNSDNKICWSAIAGEGCLPEIRYIDGLGGPYYQCRGYAGETEERKLVYYKKGATEWGEKLVITGVPKLKTNGQLQVFPNPARDVVTFQLNGDSEFHEVRIYNQTGQLVKTECFEGNSYKLHLTGLKSGIYLYKLTSSHSLIHTGKLVVD